METKSTSRFSPSPSAAASPLSVADGSSDVSQSLGVLALDESLSFIDELDENDSSLLEDENGTARFLDDMQSLVPEEQSIQSQESHALSSPIESDNRSRPRSRPGRVRPKARMEHLRQEVVALEAELARLKKQAEASSGDNGIKATKGVWAGIAKRQLLERHRAEIENVKLREQLDGQLRLARSLQKLLRKREDSDSDTRIFERKRSLGMPARDLDETIKEIKQRINKQLDEVCGVMEECGLSSVSMDMDEVRAVSDSQNSICVELVTVKEFPFKFERVAGAVWSCVSASHIQLTNGYYGVSERSDWLCEIQFSVKLSVRRSEAMIHFRGVGVRRMEAGRSMIVFESEGFMEGQLFTEQSVTIRERGYILIEGDSSSPLLSYY